MAAGLETFAFSPSRRASTFFLWRRMKNASSASINANATTPPTAPPAIAPTFDPPLCASGVADIDGLAVADDELAGVVLTAVPVLLCEAVLVPLAPVDDLVVLLEAVLEAFPVAVLVPADVAVLVGVALEEALVSGPSREQLVFELQGLPAQQPLKPLAQE